MASSGGPEEEFGDNVRKNLLSDLEQRVGLAVPPETWACLWLADIERLKAWIEQSREEKISNLTRNVLYSFERDHKLLAQWAQRGRDRAESVATTPVVDTPQLPSQQMSVTSSHPSSPISGSLKRRLQTLDMNAPKYRSAKVTSFCEARDQKRCIITRDYEHDVAHIYPFSLRTHCPGALVPQYDIWTALSWFWSKERIDEWQKVIFPDGKFVERCDNLLCLTPSAHRYHGKGYFALKPVSMSEDQKSLTVKFFWLLKGEHPRNVNICSTPSLECRDQGPGYARLINHETTSLIRSGDEITLNTEDPVNQPLPNIKLLEMQWILNRVIALSGAAEEAGDADNDDNDDDDNNDIDQIFLLQDEDFDMINSEDGKQSLPTDSNPFSSPPSSLAPSVLPPKPSQMQQTLDYPTEPETPRCSGAYYSNMGH